MVNWNRIATSLLFSSFYLERMPSILHSSIPIRSRQIVGALIMRPRHAAQSSRLVAWSTQFCVEEEQEPTKEMDGGWEREREGSCVEHSSAREVHIYEPVITLDLRRRASSGWTTESGSFSVPWNNVGRGSSARPAWRGSFTRAAKRWKKKKKESRIGIGGGEKSA